MSLTTTAGTQSALASLAGALRETADELHHLAARADALREELATGMALGEAMSREARPLIITRLVNITDRLHEVGGAVRRAEAHQLQAEGHSHQRIADIFGVTRQRAAALLKPVPPDRPGPKRPRSETGNVRSSRSRELLAEPPRGEDRKVAAAKPDDPQPRLRRPRPGR